MTPASLLVLGALAAAAAFDARDVPASEWAVGSGSLTVAFLNGPTASGATTPEVLRPATVAMPTFTFFDASAPATTLYTALVLDRDAPNASVPLRSPLRHMALAGLSQAQLRAGVSWATLGPGANGSSVALFNYSGPNPPAGSGCHRYYAMLYTQTAAVSPSIPPEQGSRFSWDFPAWAASQSLTKVASATTYFRTQNWDAYAGPCDGAPTAAAAGGLSPGAAAGVAVAVLAAAGGGVGAALYARALRRKEEAAERGAGAAVYETMSPLK
jgi:phosphatidylethanolamine-binding protein (PEBP) family uncharacterized protein